MSRTLIPKKRTAEAVAPVSRFRGQLRSEQFRDHLVREFSRMSAGAKIASERELARESGLSLLTVNKVLATLVAQGFVERRRGQGSFVAERKTAPAAPPSGLRLLRFITREPERALRPGSRDYLSLFYKGLREAAALDGLEVMLTPFELAADGTEALPETTFASPSIEGAIFVECGVPDYRRLWRFLEENRRVVAFDFAAPERGLNSVVFDNAGGTREAAEHCLAHGHTRLAFVGPAGNVGQPGDERLNGFREALTRAGLDAQKAPVILGDYRELPQALQKTLSAPAAKRPTAFVGFSDEFAKMARQAAQSCGLRVPEDVSVVGFGGHADDPASLDTIVFDEIEMGRMAYVLWKSNARGLVRRHSGRLVVRGSVGASEK
jgi:GntR family transcriptional regulator of arabinose operon